MPAMGPQFAQRPSSVSDDAPASMSDVANPHPKFRGDSNTYALSSFNRSTSSRATAWTNHQGATPTPISANQFGSYMKFDTPEAPGFKKDSTV